MTRRTIPSLLVVGSETRFFGRILWKREEFVVAEFDHVLDYRTNHSSFGKIEACISRAIGIKNDHYHLNNVDRLLLDRWQSARSARQFECYSLNVRKAR